MMQRFCDDVEPHEHASWGYSAEGGFATALEAQYPEAMCEQLIKFVNELCAEKGVKLSPSLRHSLCQNMRKLQVFCCPALDAKRCLQSPCRHVFSGSKLLREKGEYGLVYFWHFPFLREVCASGKSLWHPFGLAAHARPLVEVSLRTLDLQWI